MKFVLREAFFLNFLRKMGLYMQFWIDFKAVNGSKAIEIVVLISNNLPFGDMDSADHLNIQFFA